MKNKIAALALLLTMSLTLTACSLGDLPVIGKFFGNTSGPVTLTMWGVWEKPEVMDMLIKKYQETHPNVTITYEDRSVLKPEDYKDRVFSRADQALGADIVRIHNSWVPSLRSVLSAMPSSMMDANTYQTSFYPVSAQSAVFDGKIYALPAYYDGLVLVYNKDHFEEIGQDTPPTVWEEFRRIALRLKVVTAEENSSAQKVIRSGAAIGTADNIDHFSDILGLMWSQANVTIPDEIDSRAAQDALTFYTNFVKEDNVWEPSFPEAAAAFAQEKVSMIIVPSWAVLDILAVRPDLNLAVAPVPQAIVESPATWGSFWMDAVPSSSKNQKAAWEFLNFLSQEEQQLTLFSEASKIRPFGAAYSRVSLGTQLQNNVYLKPLVDTAPFAKSAEISARSGNKKQVDALRTAVNEVLGGATAEDALKKAKEAITK